MSEQEYGRPTILVMDDTEANVDILASLIFITGEAGRQTVMALQQAR